MTAQPKQLDLAAICREFQRNLEQQLGFSRASIPHAGTQGGVNEDHWIDVLRNALPRRYDVAKALVLDSDGEVSDHIDCVIFDPQYTPTLFNQEHHRFIAAEAVYAVLEIKPVLNKETLQYAADKAASVRRLHRTSAPISHAGGVFPPKGPSRILAGVLALESGWTDGLGATFQEHLGALAADRALDFGCVLRGGAFERDDGKITCTSPEHSLAWFLFRLLARLQPLATVPATDWNRYSAALHRDD